MINLIKKYKNNLPETLAKWTIDYIDKNIIENRIKEYNNNIRPIKSEVWYENINWPHKILSTNKWEISFMRVFDRLIKKYKKEYIKHQVPLYHYVYIFTISNYGGFKTETINKSLYSITGLNNISIVIGIDYDRSY